MSLCECIQISINTLIIMELQREIRGKYKSYTVSEKKAILEETKGSFNSRGNPVKLMYFF